MKETTLAILKGYDFSREVKTPIEELVGVEEQMDTERITPCKRWEY